VTLAYLLFRIADTLEDATLWPPARQQEELARLARLLRQPSAGEARTLAADWLSDPPLDHAGYLELLGEMPAVIEAFCGLEAGSRELIAHHLGRTIERMGSFVARAETGGQLQLDNVAELRAYCYAVAGIVGEMLTELFLRAHAELGRVAQELRAAAASFGEALQLVNILKDSAADAREGRRYLPSQEGRAAVFELARADLEAARDYVLCLQRASAPRGLVAFTALPVLLAWSTLERVERQGPSAKLSRPEVQALVEGLELALDRGQPPIPERRL
jgi:farnesyl-diphosphate farnesyltransferase